jgi:cysteine-rich repeat protein
MHLGDWLVEQERCDQGRRPIRTLFAHLLLSFAFLLTSLTVPSLAYAQTCGDGAVGITWTARESNRNWWSITSSSDGTKLAAVVYGGQIYTSTDSGITWTARESNRNWWSITSSSDGTKLVAVVNGGQIYTSTDSGTTWTARESNRNWWSITSSSDGTKLAAVGQNTQIYTSTDSGVTWTPRGSSRDWRSITSSSDGTKLAAVHYDYKIYTSTDSGVTWTTRGPDEYWYSITSSSDGTKLAAAADAGYLYTSTDSGVTWTEREDYRGWTSITSSSDGTKLAAVVQSGQIYTSTDSGVTWTARESNRSWRSITSSSDGTKLAAVVYGGRIYTSAMEQCDDGNSTPGDGCSDSCQIEAGWYCPTAGSSCSAVCGDGVVFGAETCDDGNDNAGDGCSDSCQIESGYYCPTAGSRCCVDEDGNSTCDICGDGAVGITWTARESNRTWFSITSSSDGTKLAAVVDGGQIYTSTVSGVTWTARESNRNWFSITSSSDGSKLAAVEDGGQIYTSTDSGVSWTARESNRYWSSITSSSDGTKLAAVVWGGQIYTSADSGVTWTARGSSRDWRSITSSSDGTKLAAVEEGGQIYTSTDSGATWTARESNRTWYSITSSSDGTKLAAVVQSGKIYTSTDSGVTWTARESNRGWSSITSSSDGTKLAAVVEGGQIYTSAMEQCDDGNSTPGDGCSDSCQIEAGWYCPTAGSPCCDDGNSNSTCDSSESTCGDGSISGPENCDDGNSTAGDGCGDSCQIESGYYCGTPGSYCCPDEDGNSTCDTFGGTATPTATPTNSPTQTGTTAVFTDADNTAQGFAGGTAIGARWNTNQGNSMVLAADTDCDGNTDEGESTFVNCAELDSSWTPQWSALKSYWKFNNSWEPSVGSASFTPANGAALESPGKMGSHAASFDGINDRATTTTDLDLDMHQEYTVSLWFNPRSHQMNLPIFLLQGGVSYLELQGSSTPNYLCVTQDDGDHRNCFPIDPLNRWHHLAVTYSSDGYHRLYLNGKEIAGDQISNALADGPATIFLGGYSGSHANARVDELGIWNRMLTADEVATIYARQSPYYSGQITSRVVGNESAISWRGLKWRAALPFGKELPGDVDGSGTITSADSESSSDYSGLVGSTGSTTDNDLMSGIQGLWRMNEQAPNFSGSFDFADSSGNARHLTESGLYTQYDQVGRFDKAAEFSGSSHASTAMANLSGDATYTVSTWVRPTANSSVQNILGWGDGYSENGAAGLAINNIYSTGTVVANFSASLVEAGAECRAKINEWNHIVLVRSPGTYAFTTKLFVNGTSCSITANDPEGEPNVINSQLFIGQFANVNVQRFWGMIDEVAIWNRALLTSEVHQLYRRGTNRIHFQVRSCSEPSCADNPSWIGPSNTNGSYFSETHNTRRYNYDLATCAGSSIVRGSPSLLFSCFTAALSNLGSQRYFQYRAILESDDATTSCNYGSGATWCSPELHSVQSIANLAEPTPTHIPTNTPTTTSTNTPSATPTRTPTQTNTPTATPTSTVTTTPTPTSTATGAPTATHTATPTPLPTTAPTIVPPPPPSIVIEVPPESAGNNQFAVNKERVVLSGTGTLGHTIEIQVDGIVVGTALVNANSSLRVRATTGAWQFKLPPLATGTREIVTVSIDEFGNRSAPSSSMKLVVLDVAPLDFAGGGDTTITSFRRVGDTLRFKTRSSSESQWSNAEIEGLYPAPADYDNDGITDLAAVGVVRGKLQWNIKLSSTGSMSTAALGDLGDTIISGCHFESDQGASLSTFRSDRREVVFRDYSSSTERVVKLSKLTHGDLLGCGDTDGDGKDEILFRVRGGKKRSSSVAAFDTSGNRRLFTGYNQFLRGFVVRRTGTQVPLVAMLRGTTKNGRQVKITAMAGSFAFPMFYISRSATIGTGIFTKETNEQIPGLFWADNRSGVVYRRLLTKDAQTTTLFNLPDGYTLIRSQNVMRTQRSPQVR